MSTFQSHSCSGLHLEVPPPSSSVRLSIIASAMACSTAAGSSSGNLALRRAHVTSFPRDVCSARSNLAAPFTPPECQQAYDAHLYLSSGVACIASLLPAVRALVYSVKQGRREGMSPRPSASQRSLRVTRPSKECRSPGKRYQSLMTRRVEGGVPSSGKGRCSTIAVC